MPETTTPPPFEVYAIDPNDDAHLLAESASRLDAIWEWTRLNAEYVGSGCSIEIWRDGKPLTEGRCEGCEQFYAEDEVSDQCGCSDDGSGQYVKDLPGEYCDDCHDAYHHDPREYDDYE